MGSTDLGHASPPDYNAPVNQYDTQFTVTLPSPPLFHPRTPTNHHDFPTILIPEAPTRLATNSPSLPSAASSSSASSPSANSRGAFASPRVGGRGMGQGVNGGNTPPSPRGADNIIWEKTSVERQCGGDTGRMVDLLLAERNTLATQNAQLWKLMEKQRAQTTTMQKDVDRLRSERDRATYQLAHLEASSNSNHALLSRNSNRSLADGQPRGIPNSVSAVGLGIQDHNRAHKQRMGGMAPAPIFGEEHVEMIHSSSTTDRPALTRHHSDSNADSLAMREVEEYAKETRATNSGGSGTSMSTLVTPSPAFKPKSPARSRAANRAEGQLPPNPPPPEQHRTPVSLHVVSPTMTSPSEDTPRAALLPAASIATTSACPPPISDSRNTYEPELEEMLTIRAKPEIRNFPTIPAPQEAMADSSSRAPFDTEKQLSEQDPRSFLELDSASERSSLLKDEVTVSGSPQPNTPYQHDAESQEPQERILTSHEYENTEAERQPVQPQLQEVKPPILRHGSSGPLRQQSFASDSQDDHPSSQSRLKLNIINRPPSKFTPQLLPFTRCTIPSSKIAPNALGKDVLCFVVGVSVRAPGSSQTYTWNVAKLFSAFLELDTNVKSNIGGRKEVKAAGIAALPDGRSWKDFAPTKVDQRKATLEIYLQSLLTAPLGDKTELCEFLLTNVIREDVASNKISSDGAVKSGYLTKRGKAFGRWQSRFFVLEGQSLHYYENRGGSHLGTIPISGAQIGRQHKNAIDTQDTKAHLHAFLIIEAGKTSASQSRHVLCAESDDERDSWVNMLVRFIHGDPRDPAPGRATMPILKDVKMEDHTAVSRRGTGSSVASDKLPVGRGHQKAARDEQPPVLKGTSQPTLQPSKDDKSEIEEDIDPSNSHMQMRSTPPPMYEGPAVRHQAKQASLSSVPSVTHSLSSSLPSDLERQIRAGAASIDRSHERGARAQEPTPMRNKRQSMMPPPRGLPPSTRPPGNEVPQQEKHPPHPPQVPRSVSNVATRQVPPSPEQAPVYRDKISGPQGGMAIPTGFKFGGKITPPEGQYDRERKAKSGRFWGFGKSGTAATPTALPPPPVFGVPLEDSIAVASIANLPAVVFRCILYLEERGAKSEEGIFRLSGSSAVIKALKDRFNAEGDIDLLAVDERWDLHAISGLLKLFFRDLPTSLLTRELHMKFLAVMDLISSEERVAELAKLVSELPPNNYSLLRALTSHLILIVGNSEENKMNLRNIGIVFSPTLGIPAGIFSDLVTHFRAIFDVSSDVPLPSDLAVDDDAEAMATYSTTHDVDKVEAKQLGGKHRNSQIYAASGVDAMLGTSGRVLAEQVEESDVDESQFSSDHGSMATGQEHRQEHRPGGPDYIPG